MYIYYHRLLGPDKKKNHPFGDGSFLIYFDFGGLEINLDILSFFLGSLF
jgi:hypothetical protein